MTLGELAQRLEAKRAGQGFLARCPAHEDHHASLSLGLGEDGRILLNCHAGCAFREIVGALRLEPKDLSPAREPRPRVVATYPYRDERGALLFEVQRFEPKTFRPRRPDGRGGFVPNLQDVRRIPYRLNELVEADPSRLVFVVEGEKDVDRLVGKGLLATSAPGGAGKWGSVAKVAAEVLRGRRVVVIPDNDLPGRKHATDVIESLREVAEVSVLVLEGLREKGDVSDWLDAGHSAEELVALALETRRADVWTPAGANGHAGVREREPGEDDDVESPPPRWKPASARALALGNYGTRITTGIEALDRATRGGFRSRGRIACGGAPGAGKTTFALWLARRWALEGHYVAFLASDEKADGILIRWGQLEGLDRNELEVDGLNEAKEILAERVAPLGDRFLLVDADEGHGTIEEVSDELRRRRPEGAVSILIIDSLQTVASEKSGTADSPRLRVDAVLGAVKRAAAEHLVIATSELNRGSYRGGNPAERTADIASFKESGGIEYGMDVALLFRNVPGSPNDVDVAITKNRLRGAGAPESFRLELDRVRASFAEVASGAAANDPDEEFDRIEQARRQVVLEVVEKTAMPIPSMRQLIPRVRKAGRRNRVTARQNEWAEVIRDLRDEGEIVLSEGRFQCRVTSVTGNGSGNGNAPPIRVTRYPLPPPKGGNGNGNGSVCGPDAVEATPVTVTPPKRRQP